MKAIPVNETAMAAHLKAIESDRILNRINSNIMDAAYELQKMEKSYPKNKLKLLLSFVVMPINGIVVATLSRYLTLYLNTDMWMKRGRY